MAPLREETKEYKALRQWGHSAAKALEIIIDFERGEKHAVQWIEALLRLQDKEPGHGL